MKVSNLEAMFFFKRNISLTNVLCNHSEESVFLLIPWVFPDPAVERQGEKGRK